MRGDPFKRRQEMTIEDTYKAWLAMKRPCVKRSSLQAYQKVYADHIQGRLGDVQVSGMDRRAVTTFAYGLVDGGLSVKTAKYTVMIVRQLLQFAQDELGESVPAARLTVRWPKRNGRAAPQRYTDAQSRVIMRKALASPTRIKLGVALCLMTGLRVGEACGLRLDDVDFRRRVLHVRRTVERISRDCSDGGARTEVVISTPKTADSEREVPLPDILAPLLRRAAKGLPCEWYVLSGRDKPEEPRTFREGYRRFIVKDCRLPYVKLHGLRHTFGSALTERGVDVKTVATLLGHSTVATTLNTYVHPVNLTLSAAVNKTLRKAFVAGRKGKSGVPLPKQGVWGGGKNGILT